MSTGPIFLPALRCAMGDWVYYMTSMTFEDVSIRLTRADELVKSKVLGDLIQREIKRRSSKISSYLINQPERLFNSLVVAVYEGEPDWLDIELLSSDALTIGDIDSASATRINETLGLLKLSGAEKLFALDGQHRVEGIKQALTKKKELRSEEVGIIFVAHNPNGQGPERTRRLFTTLNKYAKPVTKGETIALDEDDSCAIVTRELVEKNPLLKVGHIVAPMDKSSLERTDETSVTTLVTVYDVAYILLNNRTIGGSRWTKSKLTKLRPKDEQILLLYENVTSFWNAMLQTFQPYEEARISNAAEKVASKYRTENGGSLLFRPAGQVVVASACRIALDNGTSFTDSINAFKSVDLNLQSENWSGLLWNAGDKTMIVRSKNLSLAARLLLHISKVKVAGPELLADYNELTDNLNETLPDVKS